jgi:hypothetical protein
MLGLLALSGCAPDRTRVVAANVAWGVPAPAAKPNAFVFDRGAGGSPYANHVLNSSPPAAVPAPKTIATPQPAPAQPLPIITTAPAPPAPIKPPDAPTPPVFTPEPVGGAAPSSLPEPPAVQLPEPPAPKGQAKSGEAPPVELPQRPSEPVPQRPSLPEGPTEVHEVGESPEPEPLATPRTPPAPMAEPAPIKPVSATEPVRSQTDSAQLLTGTVESWRKTHRLRYAAVDVEDANGGRVTLIGGTEVERLHDGQRVRVRGTLIPAADRASAPTFQVLSVEVVD